MAVATTEKHVNMLPVQLGISGSFGNLAYLSANVVDGIVEVAEIVLPLAAVVAVVFIPLRKHSKPQKESQVGPIEAPLSLFLD